MEYIHSFPEHKERFSREWVDSLLYPILSEEERNNLQIIDIGKESLVAIVEGKRVFKFPRALFVLNNYIAEDNILPMIAEFVHTAVPKKVAEYGDKKEYSSFFVEYEHMPGEALHADQMTVLSLEHKESLGQQIGVFLARLHTIPVGIGKELPHPDTAAEYAKELEKIHLIGKKYFSQNVLQNITDMYQEYSEKNSSRQSMYTIVHNDFGQDHIFVQGDRLTGVLDWGQMRISDPALDWRWREGPRAIDDAIYTSALKQYSKMISLDSTFLQRVDFYNRKKCVNRFLREPTEENVAYVEERFFI